MVFTTKKSVNVLLVSVFVGAFCCNHRGLMFAGGGAGFQKQSKPPWEIAGTNVNTTSELSPSW